MERLMVEFLVRSLLIALVTAAVLKLLRVPNARAKHAAWLGVALVMLVLPAWTAFGPHQTIHILPRAKDPVPVRAMTATAHGQIAVLTAVDAPVARHDNARTAWLAIYGISLFVLLLRLAIGTVRARFLVARAVTRNGRLTSTACASPITVGFFRPVVILPNGWDAWEEERLDAVLAHEAGHARHRDPLAQWIALFNRAVFWFYPLAWWLERRISALAEEACDEAVLANGYDRVAYSESLLAFARKAHESGARVRAFGMAMPGQFLPRRIRKIMEGIPARRISRTRTTFAAFACALGAIVFTGSAIGYVRVHADEEQTPAPPSPPAAPRPPAPAAPPIVPEPPRSPEPPQPPPAPAPEANDQSSGTVTVDAARIAADAQKMAEFRARMAELREQISKAQAQMQQAQKEMQKLNMDQAIRATTGEEIQKQIAEAKRSMESDEIRRQLDEAQRALESGEMQKQLEEAMRSARDMQGAALSAPSSNVITSMVKPHYTDEARAAGITGSVELSVSVDPMGRAVDVHVTQGLGHGLDEAAVGAVKQWHFVSWPDIGATPQAREVRVEFRFAADGGVSTGVLPAR